MDPLHLGACALKPLHFHEILPRECKQAEKHPPQKTRKQQTYKKLSLGHYGPDEQLPGHSARNFGFVYFVVLLCSRCFFGFVSKNQKSIDTTKKTKIPKNTKVGDTTGQMRSCLATVCETCFLLLLLV